LEIEAEITIHALQLGLPAGEIQTPYKERPDGLVSNLNTIKDDIRILSAILLLFIYVRPIVFFGMIGTFLALVSLGLGIPICLHFIDTGLMPRLPTPLLAAALGLLVSLCLACRTILDGVTRSRLETKRCWYLLSGSMR
jgi:hypothetical protein